MKAEFLSMLCFLLTGAHFLRGGNISALVVCLVMAVCSFSCTAWLRNSSTFLLSGSVLVWFMTLFGFVQERMDMGVPWLRLSAILGCVICLHLVAIYKNGKKLSKLSTLQSCIEMVRGIVFSLSLIILLSLDAVTSFPLLLGERLFDVREINGVVALVLAWWGGSCAAALMEPALSRKRRLLMWGCFSTMFFIQFAVGVFLIPSLLMTGSLHLPAPFMMISGPLYRGEGIFMITLFSISVLLVGSAWCSHLCYFGVWDGIAANFQGKKLSVRTFEKKPRDWRWVALMTAIAVPLCFSFLDVSLTWAVGVAIVGLMLAPLFWVINFHASIRIYCGFICPMGLVARLLGRINTWRVRIQEDLCSGCGKCASVCRDRALNREGERYSVKTRCTLCRDCLSQCSRNAIKFDCSLPGRHHSFRAEFVFIVIISLVHVVFLATARM